MKRIYAFTLDSDDYPSEKFRHNLRLIAFLLYDTIDNYDVRENTALIVNKVVKNNGIYEGSASNELCFEHDCDDLKYTNYEPFIIGNCSFALTINDEVMSEQVICDLMDYIIRLLSLNYQYTVRSIGYPSKNINDESHRKKAIIGLHNLLNGKIKEVNPLVKKRAMIRPFSKGKVQTF